MSKNEKVRIQSELPNEVYVLFKRQAEKEGISIPELTRRIVKIFLSKGVKTLK